MPVECLNVVNKWLFKLGCKLWLYVIDMNKSYLKWLFLSIHDITLTIKNEYNIIYTINFLKAAWTKMCFICFDECFSVQFFEKA